MVQNKKRKINKENLNRYNSRQIFVKGEKEATLEYSEGYSKLGDWVLLLDGGAYPYFTHADAVKQLSNWGYIFNRIER